MIDISLNTSRSAFWQHVHINQQFGRAIKLSRQHCKTSFFLQEKKRKNSGRTNKPFSPPIPKA